ncbi:hypothetical protein TREMEDRAFT_62173 [Tremella mesenterica DSM 1558]|uniref:uncharacterized protein n=1 Tax=Tremella mesenterica (strain ATCC 24925 / CBS 8224 / DSM 1558 / NBRC 9311 / NRRL Y-6157 / RJB 2259-6 / UBC 559-6) TaxID=578456 RepID=UPI0003F49C38|nr:uncharacterized protein TREMEDRAFT_62173 [Tremella mesenterica DSM 1558]EIW69309.1 hypothetical protein TREMEDRAFT_62173 [Tremella mesenterica DSM 1558]
MDASIPTDAQELFLMLLGFQGCGSTQVIPLSDQVKPSQGTADNHESPSQVLQRKPNTDGDRFQLWPEIDGGETLDIEERTQIEDYTSTDKGKKHLGSGFDPRQKLKDSCNAPYMTCWVVEPDRTDGSPIVTWVKQTYVAEDYDTPDATNLATDHQVVQLRLIPVVNTEGRPDDNQIQEAIQKMILPPEPEFLNKIGHLVRTTSLSVVTPKERLAVQSLLGDSISFKQADNCIFEQYREPYPNDFNNMAGCDRYHTVRYDFESVERFARAAYKSTSQTSGPTLSVPIAGMIIVASLRRATRRVWAKAVTYVNSLNEAVSDASLTKYASDGIIPELTVLVRASQGILPELEHVQMLVLDTEGRLIVTRATLRVNAVLSMVTRITNTGHATSRCKKMLLALPSLTE